MHLVGVVGGVLVVLSALISTTSALVYGTQFRWWTHSDGRHLLADMAVIAGALSLWAGRLIVTGQLTNPGPADSWPWIRMCGFALIAWVVSWRLLKIVRAWTERRRENRNLREV